MMVGKVMKSSFTKKLLCTAFIASFTLFPALAADMIVNADKSLEWNQQKGFYEARGNAHAYQGDQEIFADDLKAFYDVTSSERTITKIYANGNVRFADDAHTGSGSRLVYQMDTDDYMLNGPNARIDGPDSKARAYKDIHFQREEGRVHLREQAEIKLSDGRHLTGDDLQLYLNSEDNIERIEARGNVTVTQASGARASADNMEYDRIGDKATLTGNVTIIDGGNQLSGDKAEIDFETGISKMLSNNSAGRVSGRFTGTKQ